MYTKYICKENFDCTMTGDDITLNASWQNKRLFTEQRESSVALYYH